MLARAIMIALPNRLIYWVAFFIMMDEVNTNSRANASLAPNVCSILRCSPGFKAWEMIAATFGTVITV